MLNLHGAQVGEKFDAFLRVGIYIPGGAAPLVSTALMTIPLARVAGCRDIVVCTPCDRNGQVNPALLHAARGAGATEVYRIGGAQAIAAMARRHTGTIRKVQQNFWAGQRLRRRGQTALVRLRGDGFAAGDTRANCSCWPTTPLERRLHRGDLLAQAEHGSGHERVWLLTDSDKILRAVQKEIDRQLPKRARRELIERALARNGWLVRVATIEQGIGVGTASLRLNTSRVMCRQRRRIKPDVWSRRARFSWAMIPRRCWAITSRDPATCCPPAARALPSRA